MEKLAERAATAGPGRCRPRTAGTWISPGASRFGRISGAPTAPLRSCRRRQVQGPEPSGFPEADLCQLPAYCTELQVPVGHQVYAGVRDAQSYQVRGADITIVVHALDLTQPPERLLAQVGALAGMIARADGSAQLDQKGEVAAER
jgi:hypothetical protein